MARRVFFSFHYEADIWRASVVRNSWVTKPDREAAGFFDAGLWERAKRRGAAAIRRMIGDGLENTSVTAVLIGSETYNREWVKHEIKESHNRGNGLLGIYIHEIEDKNGSICSAGKNPFESFYIEREGRRTSFSSIYPTYLWVTDRGYFNLANWIEQAAKKAGK
jgi:hypothetical protein